VPVPSVAVGTDGQATSLLVHGSDSGFPRYASLSHIRCPPTDWSAISPCQLQGIQGGSTMPDSHWQSLGRDASSVPNPKESQKRK